MIEMLRRMNTIDGFLNTCRRQVRTCFKIAFKVVSFAAVVETRIAAHAQEVTLAIARFLIETVFLEAEALRFGVLGTLES